MDMEILIRYSIARFLSNYKVVGIIKLAYPDIQFERSKLYFEIIQLFNKGVLIEENHLQMYYGY